MVEGKVLGKGLSYISGLDQTYSIGELNQYSYSNFSMLVSFCNEEELDNLYVQFEGSIRGVCILSLMGKV